LEKKEKNIEQESKHYADDCYSAGISNLIFVDNYIIIHDTKI
jgi:hypothetical protein